MTTKSETTRSRVVPIIYLAGIISGRNGQDVINYFETMAAELEELGYMVLHPMTGKGYLRTDRELRPHGYENPVSTNHAIYERDQWMVRSADIVFVNLMGATERSIGCMMELAWAALLGKHTVVAMEEENIHRHAFVLEAADIVFNKLGDALYYLELFTGGGE